MNSFAEILFFFYASLNNHKLRMVLDVKQETYKAFNLNEEGEQQFLLNQSLKIT